MRSGSAEVIQKLLNDLEKRRKRAWIKNATAEFLLVLFGSLGLISLLSYISSNNVYFSVLKNLAILAVCSGFVKFFVPAILKKEGKAKLALELEKISPGLGEDTLNAVLLRSDLTQTEKGLGVSRFLTEAHIDEVASKLESLMDLSLALPGEKIKGYWKPLTAIFALSITILIFAPKEFRGFLFSSHILPTFEPNLLEFADIKIEYKYPAYTKLPPEVVRGSTGDVKAIKGTHVIFEATTLKRSTKGELVTQNGLAIPISSDGRKIKGEFTIFTNGDFFIQDKEGRLKSRIFKITSEEDENPKVAIESPTKGVIEIGEKRDLDIFYKARDDFGLTKLLLVWKTKKGESSKSMGLIKEEPKSIEGRFTWDLSDVQSEPSEIIEVRINAYDNDIVSGPKVGSSNTIEVKINDPRKRHENILSSAEKLLEQLLDVLADDIEHRSREDNASASNTKKTQEDIASKIENASLSLNQMINNMKDDDFSDYTYFLGLSNMRTSIKDMLDERTHIIVSFSAEDLPRLGDLIKREINEFEDDIIFLDSALKGEKLRESLMYGRDALSKYTELSELLKKLKQSGNEETKKEIEKKTEELKNLMSQLVEKLSSLSRNINDEFLNSDSFKTIDLQKKLNEIINLTSQGKIDEALNLLAGLEANLQEMIAAIQSGSQSFSSATLSKNMTKLNETLERIKHLEESEKSLKENTESAKYSLLKNPPRKTNPLEFVEREKKKLDKLKNLLMETKSKVSQNMGAREFIGGSFLIERAINEADELKHRLEALEFNEAYRHAKDIEEQTTGLRNLNDLKIGAAPKANSEIEQSARIAQEIRRDLEHFGEIERNEEGMGKLSERQNQIAREAFEFSNNLKGSSQDNFSPKIREKLSESERFMRRASSNLVGKEISKAISNQEDALEALKQAKEEAKGLLDKYQQSARGNGLPVPLVLGREQFQEGDQGVDTGHVNIPPSEESKTGKEFKEGLLKALKDGSPDGYGELNKKYYERIIK
jgi:hypothetical protein